MSGLAVLCAKLAKAPLAVVLRASAELKTAHTDMALALARTAIQIITTGAGSAMREGERVRELGSKEVGRFD